MEAAAKSTKIPNNTQLQTVAPLPHDPLAKPEIQSNKRKLADNTDLRNSAYFKIHALARQLRPQFIHVLQTPDFRNCKAAHEIKLQMKLVVDLYKQMTAKGPLAGKNMLGAQSSGRHIEGKQSDLLQPKQSLDESMELKKPQTPPFSSDKKLNNDIGHPRKSYIVGGSAIGWNFITFSSNKPVYYGVSKESFQSSKKRTDQSLPRATDVLNDNRSYYQEPTTPKAM